MGNIGYYPVLRSGNELSHGLTDVQDNAFEFNYRGYKI